MDRNASHGAEGPIPLDRWLLAAVRPGTPIMSGFVDRVGIAANLIRSVKPLHAAGRVHGGIRPATVLVDQQGAVTLLPSADGPAAESYRAPEAVAGAAPTMAGDVYAVGAVLWELLTLRPPLLVEENITRFHRRKRAGEVDLLPAEVRGAVPADLLAIARKAMAPDPALRWSDLDEMLLALGGWMHRLESVAVTLQAEAELGASASGVGDSSGASREFRSALALWPENPAARDGLAVSEMALGVAAVRAGDARAARDHLAHASGANHPAVQVEFERLRTTRRNRRWGLAVAGAVVLLTCLVVAGWGLFMREDDAWRLDAEWRFVRGASTAGLESSLYHVDEHAAIEPPLGDGLDVPLWRTMWLKQVDGRGDLRLGMEVEWVKDVDGIELMFSAPREQPRVYHMTQAGYSCQFGGYRGTQTFLSASPVAGWPNRPSPVAHAFVPGRIYRLEMERRDGHLCLRVDGQTVWDQREVLPIGDSRFRWLAVRAWTDIRIHRLYVEKPRRLPVQTPLSTADALASAGLHADALAAYQTALYGTLPDDLRSQALVRGHAVAASLPDRREPRQALLRQAELDIPMSSPFRLDVQMSEVQALWREREWEQAIRLAAQIQQEHPAARCALSLLEQRVGGAPPQAISAVLRLVASGPPVSHLELHGLGLTDLTALSGMRLESLNIAGNRITDLAPLRGMPMKVLNCSHNRIQDLSALTGMHLLRLEADGNQISDLRPLAGSPLELLLLAGNQVADLTPLAGLPLTRLGLERNPVVSLEPLRTCTRLVSLQVTDAPLDSLRGIPLESLTSLAVIRCPVADVSVLAGSRLTGLQLDGTGVTDCSALPRGSLQHLRLAHTPIPDLATLRGLRLALLDLTGTRLSRLDGMSDITFAPGAILLLDDTFIDSLRGLTADGLQSLSIRRTRVEDLEPIAGKTIHDLALDGIPAADLSPVLRVLDLRRISAWNAGTARNQLDALADQMEQRRYQAGMVAVIRAQAAAKAGDWRRLRAMARRIGAYDRLPLGVTLPHAAASRLAQAAGARLPCLLDMADMLSLVGQRGWEVGVWTGLMPAESPGGTPRWSNGRSDPHLAVLLQPRAEIFQGQAWYCPASPFIEPAMIGVDARMAETLEQEVVLEW